MKHFLAFLLLCCTTLSSSAQVFQFHYGTANNDDAFPVKALPDGGFILAGSASGNGAGGKDASLIRTNALGQLMWARQYGGTGDETALYVQRTSDGGFILCGETFSADPAGDAFLCRTDSLGNLLWWKNYGGNYYDIAYSVVQLSDGGFAVAGLIESTPLGYDAFLLRTDANGDTLWTKKYGGPGIDHAVQVIQTSDAGFLFCGKILSYGAGSCDCWLVKTDANGDTLWTNIIGGNAWDESMSVVERPDGYAICGGSSSTGTAGYYDFLLMKTDLSGNLQWSKLYGGGMIEASYCLLDVPGSGYAFCGYTETFGPGHSRGTDSANVFVVRTDYNGDTLWAAAFGGLLKEECFGIAPTVSGGFVMSGYTGSFGDSLQAYLFSVDSMGYAGCNEKRAYPDVNAVNFTQTHHAVDVTRGMSVSAFPAVGAQLVAQATQLCGGPLGVMAVGEQPAFSIYPNPANDAATITFPGNAAGELKITDASGRILKRVNIPANTTQLQIDLSEFAPGFYFVVTERGVLPLIKR